MNCSRFYSRNRWALICLTPLVFAAFFNGKTVLAEDCTGVLPTADCTLDEDTTADLTIDAGVSLFIGTPVTIGHDIDGDNNPGDGTISTFGVGTTINQTSDIGSNIAIDELLINDDNTWTTSGAIITNNDGSDINLGVVDGGETLNFNNGASFIGEIDGNALDVVNFGADGNGGNFETGGEIESITLIITSGQLTTNSTMGTGVALNSISVADGATLNINETATTGGPLDNDGLINIASDATLAADTYVADADSGTFVINVARNGGTSSTGVLNVANGGPLDLSNDTLQIAIDPLSAVLVNETVANIVVGNTAATIGPGQFVDNSFLYDFALQANGDNFDLVITVNPINETANNFNNRQVAQLLLNNLAEVDVEGFNRIQALLGAAPTEEAFNETLESLHPTVDGGFIAASNNIVERVQDFSQKRTKILLSGTSIKKAEPKKKYNKLISGQKDLRTGKILIASEKPKIRVQKEKGTVWVTPFINSMSQDALDDVDGFSGKAAGLAIGADTGRMHEDILFGLHGVIGNSSVESENANRTDTDIASLGIGAYGGVKIQQDLLLEGSVTYVRSSNDYVRYNVAGISGNNAQGNFTSEHHNIHTRISKKFGRDNGVTITPSLFANYDSVESENYKETSADLGDLTVSPGGYSTFETGVGVDVDWQKQLEGGSVLHPSVYAEYKYDVVSDRFKTLSNFAGDETQRFVSQGPNSQKNQFNIGTSVDVDISDKMAWNAGYDFEYKDSYIDQSGYVGFVYNFN